MFDDRLFDVIMGEMMASFGPDVRTDEGSLAYNACAKIAEKLEDVYGDMDALNDNMLPDTQDLEHLIRYATERGITYHYATAPIVKGEFAQEIEIGELFECGNYTYEVTELISGYNYKLKCQIEGTEANTNFGELTPVDYVDDYQGGQITELIVPGTDDEEEENFRNKVISSFQTMAFGGNKADYKLIVNQQSGVGGCKPIRRASDSPWINVYIIGSDYGVPSSEVVTAVQTAIDPTVNSGEGDGLAPICHNVQIIAVTGTAISVETRITFDTGYSIATSQTAIDDVVKAYLRTLRMAWESNEEDDTIVRISQIEAAILSVEGVIDINDTSINGSSDNVMLDYTKIPVFGEVVINV